MLLVDYHLLGYVPIEKDFHRIIHAKSAPVSALYGGENQLAQSILNMIDFSNEAQHRVYERELANGTAVNSNSQARKDIAYVHSKYAADIEARNAPPMTDEETINRLIADFAKTHTGSKEAQFLNATVNGGGTSPKSQNEIEELLGFHTFVLNL